MSVIELITGPMYCGKTTELFRRLKREKIAGKKVKLYKPTIDNRYSIENASTHDGVEMKAVLIECTREIYLGNAEVIGIEEIQFLDDKIIDLCIDLRNKGIKVIAAGLNMDFKRQPFKFRNSKLHIGDLMVHAVNTNLHSICTYGTARCGRNAFYTQRLVKSSEIVSVGGRDCYEARCLEHHII